MAATWHFVRRLWRGGTFITVHVVVCSWLAKGSGTLEKCCFSSKITFSSCFPSAASPVPSHSLVIHFSHACQSLVLSFAGVIIVGGALKRDSPLAPNGVLSYLPCTLVLWILFLLFSFVLCSAFLSPDLECAFPILSYVLRREKYRLVCMLIYSYLKLMRLVGGETKGSL